MIHGVFLGEVLLSLQIVEPLQQKLNEQFDLFFNAHLIMYDRISILIHEIFFSLLLISSIGTFVQSCGGGQGIYEISQYVINDKTFTCS